MNEIVRYDCSEMCVIVQELVNELIEETTKDCTSSCEEFSCDKRFLERENQQNGYYYVDNLMEQWNKLAELRNWHYSIDHINEICNATLKYHAFRVQWAKPMAGYTHPIIVVNVYLFVKIILEENDYSIETSYNIEGNQFVRDARFPFNPKWLLNAHDDKRSVIGALSL